MGTDDAGRQTEQNVGVDRRTALTKGVVAATVAGVAWNAPTIKGLSLRPAYAAAQSGLACPNPIPAAPGELVVNFGNDQPFNQFQFLFTNDTAGPLTWQAVWPNRPYATIPDPGSLLPINVVYNVSIVPGSNPVVYDHVFTGTVALPAFSGVLVSAGTFGADATVAGTNNGVNEIEMFTCP